MRFWLIYIVISTFLLGLMLLSGSRTRMMAGLALALIVLAPVLAQFIDATRSFAPAGSETVKITARDFGFYLLRSGLFAYALSAVLMGLAFYSGILNPLKEMLIVLMFNLFAPIVFGLGFSLIFFGAEFFGMKASYFRGLYGVGWFLASPFLGLAAWFALLPVYTLLSGLFQPVTSKLIEVIGQVSGRAELLDTKPEDSDPGAR